VSSHINLDLDDLTPTALKRLVKQLLAADDAEERKITAKMGKHNPSEEKSEGKPHKERNDLADLDEEMHGKPNTPKVEKDDMPADGGLPDIPKRGRKNA
jgi:hypothetical protein